jgi:predicted peptidase
MLSCSGRDRMSMYSEEITYRSVGNDWQNYYVTIVPEGQIRGLIVLLPGFGMPPEKFLYEIKFDSIAVRHGMILLFPSPQGPGTHYIDEASLDTLDLMIHEVSRTYNLNDKKFVIGGFSIGGTGALRYAQRIVEGKTKHHLTLAGAFAVDSPLDFERLWFSFEKELKQGPSQEVEYFLKVLRNTLGGSPNQYRLNYSKSSPFLSQEENGGRAQLLKDTPLRFYVEPDTIWWKENGWLEYEYQNAIDLDRISQQLQGLGNEHVELIKSAKKGFRKNGKRHPHSWSIVNEQELFDWILKTIQWH